MVAATYDQGDATGNAHACYGSSVGQLHGNPQAFRRNKRNRVFIGREEMPLSWGRISAVTDKGSQRTFFQLLTDKCLIFGKADGFFSALPGQDSGKNAL